MCGAAAGLSYSYIVVSAPAVITHGKTLFIELSPIWSAGWLTDLPALTVNCTGSFHEFHYYFENKQNMCPDRRGMLYSKRYILVLQWFDEFFLGESESQNSWKLPDSAVCSIMDSHISLNFLVHTTKKSATADSNITLNIRTISFYKRLFSPSNGIVCLFLCLLSMNV